MYYFQESALIIMIKGGKRAGRGERTSRIVGKNPQNLNQYATSKSSRGDLTKEHQVLENYKMSGSFLLTK